MVRSRDLLGALLLAAIALFTVFSSECAEYALKGMRLCAEALIPRMFPLTVLTSFALRLGVFEHFTRLGSILLRPTLRLDGKYLSSFMIGAIGSAPTGASAARALASDGEGEESLSSGLLLSANVSFGFLYSVVGIGLLSSAWQGSLLFLFQVTSVILVAFILRPKKADLIENRPPPHGSERISAVIASSLRDSALNMLSICGGVIFFSSLSGVITVLPIGDSVKLFLLPFLELTTGLEYISGRFSSNMTFVIASSAVGWSGLSMILQSLALSGGKLPPCKYLIGRALSALICPLLAIVAIRFGII